MLETSEMLENSGGVGAAAAGGGTASAAALNLKNEERGCGGVVSVPGGFGEEEGERGEEGDRNFTGNRWPREETLALLKIRSDMDVAFRDSTLKAPLWDEVSRKLGELGYDRGAKKCKEKFENIYKYHKRTKEGRSGRQNGKNYRFFEQLELFDNHQSSLPSPLQNKIQPSVTETTMAMPTAVTMIKPTRGGVSLPPQDIIVPCSIQKPTAEFMSSSISTTSSSEKESQGSGKKRRKLGDYFERLVKEVLEKQENLQNQFIEAIEKCEKDRVAREDAWKMQELARMKKEQEMLAHERAIAAAKDAAVIAFLQKISDQASPAASQLPENPTPIPTSFEKIIDRQENNSSGENSSQASSSRWPKLEVEALIELRTNLDLQYQDNGLKGPLWEEISAAMKKLGYDRSSKRCKEKWENINKYFKRVKESNKKRPEDSKTCPYFHLLESLYERKSKKVDNLKPEDILMQMMGQQEQQQQQVPESVTEDVESENVDDQNQEDDDEEDDEEDNGDDYQIVANNPSVTAME
uniref:Putative trihelix transcription factor GT-2 n=2 Tax=Davidia involucrata TaxID=16924 RepID=A0A5B7ADA1_DAVIN